MNESTLERLADSIEETLTAGDAPVRVTGGTVLPYHVRFAGVPYLGTQLSRVKALAGELAAVLGMPTQVHRRGAHVIVEMQRKDGATADDLLAQVDPLPHTAALGVADDGAPLLVNLESEAGAHVLVEGEGRADLLNLIAESLARWNEPEALRVGVAYGELETLAHDVADGRNGRPILVILIEGNGATPALRVVLKRGPQAGVHVVLTTERAGADLKAMFPCRIRGRGNGRFEVTTPDYCGTFYAPVTDGRVVDTAQEQEREEAER